MEIVTDCALEYVPAAGEKVGVATVVGVIVYVAVAMALAVEPDFHAPAFIVVVDETAMGPE